MDISPFCAGKDLIKTSFLFKFKNWPPDLKFFSQSLSNSTYSVFWIDVRVHLPEQKDFKYGGEGRQCYFGEKSSFMCGKQTQRWNLE